MRIINIFSAPIQYLKSVPKQYLKWIFGFVLSALLLLAALYQLEIILIWISLGKLTFEFPFFIGGSINIYWARDFWYLIIFISWLLSFICGWKLAK